MTFEARSAFVISKPIQLLIAMAIIDQLGISDRADLLIVDGFSGAASVSSQINTAPQNFGSAQFFATHAEAYSHAEKSGVSDLWIDSDVGLSKHLTLAKLKLRRPKIIVHVFEEGVGTYRNDVYAGAKRRLLSLLGAAVVFGGHFATKDIYLFDKGRYQSKTGEAGGAPIEIEKSMADFVAEHAPLLAHIFGECDFQAADHCNLYLPGWEIDREVVQGLLQDGAPLLIKPHPHDRSAAAIAGTEMLPAHYPAELLIAGLTRAGSTLTVYHHRSSAAHYMRDSPARFVSL